MIVCKAPSSPFLSPPRALCSKSVNGNDASPSAKLDTRNGQLRLLPPDHSEWFRAVFDNPTAPQRLGWPVIARGENALILAPTGTGKTLTAFLWCLDRLMLQDVDNEKKKGCRIVYVSPLKALAVDVERNLRSPLVGIANLARRKGVPFHDPVISIRTGDTPQQERARFRRDPAEILITTPESLYLLLTSQSAEALRTVDTVIVDEIHALVPTKRGAHLALTLERLESLTGRRLQRIGLSATQRPLEEVARFLGGVEVASTTPLLVRSQQSELQSQTSGLEGQPTHMQEQSRFRNSWTARPDSPLRMESPAISEVRAGWSIRLNWAQTILPCESSRVRAHFVFGQ